MNKKRYWMKQSYSANLLYQNTYTARNGVFERAYNMLCEINDYLFNLEDE